MPRHMAHGSTSSSYKKDRHPFGAAMAEDLFDLYSYEETVAECEGDEEYDLVMDDSEGEHWYQTELPLENLRELEERMRQQIHKFDRAYKKMMVYALKWYYLEQDAESNPQVEKLFKDLQMTRKLTGSDYV
jgi:hypothetical protein